MEENGENKWPCPRPHFIARPGTECATADSQPNTWPPAPAHLSKSVSTSLIHDPLKTRYSEPISQNPFTGPQKTPGPSLLSSAWMLMGWRKAQHLPKKNPDQLCLGHSLSQNTSAFPWSARRIFQSHCSPPVHRPQPLRVIHFGPPCDIYPSQQNLWHWVQQSPGVTTWP